MIERKSRFALLSKVEQRNADQVSNAMIDLLLTVSDRLLTVTADNGKEFTENEKVASMNGRFSIISIPIYDVF